MKDKQSVFGNSFFATALFIFLVGVLAVWFRGVQDPDYYWHLKSGEWMLDHRQILKEDVFSYTRRGEEWMNSAWLQQAITAWVEIRAGGHPGVYIYWAIFAAAGIVVLWLAFPTYPAWKTLLAAVTTWVILPTITPRPVMVSFLLPSKCSKVFKHFIVLASTETAPKGVLHPVHERYPRRSHYRGAVQNSHHFHFDVLGSVLISIMNRTTSSTDP